MDCVVKAHDEYRVKAAFARATLDKPFVAVHPFGEQCFQVRACAAAATVPLTLRCRAAARLPLRRGAAPTRARAPRERGRASGSGPCTPT